MVSIISVEKLRGVQFLVKYLIEGVNKKLVISFDQEGGENSTCVDDTYNGYLIEYFQKEDMFHVSSLERVDVSTIYFKDIEEISERCKILKLALPVCETLSGNSK